MSMAALSSRARLQAWLCLSLGVAGCSASSEAPIEGTPAPAPALARITAAPAARRPLAAHLEFVGSVAYNPDRVAMVGPLVAGRVAKLLAKSGSKVSQGELLAEIESPEAGQAMARFITANAHARAATAQFRRERELAQKHISSARDLDVAEAQAAQAAAEAEAARQLLRAYGLAEPGDRKVRHDTAAGRVPLRSPIDGVVVTRFVALGQAVERATDAFLVADLTALWVELELYEKDLTKVHLGQAVELTTESWPGRIFAAKVAYIEPTVSQASRTTNLRLELANAEGALRPGQFVTARLGATESAGQEAVIVVERSALQRVGGHDVVFVKQGETYSPRRVTLGASDAEYIEVTSGVQLGELVAVRGAFLLKAEMASR